ncbi:post-GPI attachment to proteins factor 3-like [Bolinopsis microptera]|uniref:post-GPI attachment to proteins factor 3-like n=1 Tax=Bolinopsis microptera TaxID=2820187 RepID=UPI003079FEF0
MRSIRTVCLISMLLLPVLSSYGDQTHEYRDCTTLRMRTCEYANLDTTLKIFGWDCLSDSQYMCALEMTEKRIALGKPILQYNGRWAFRRYIGLQEPASVFFSFCNGFAVFLGISNLVAKVPVTYNLFHTWLGYGIVCLITWFVSFLFHAKDTVTTEILDYLGASTMVMLSLYCMLLRISGRDQFGKIKNHLNYKYGLPIFLLWAYHAYNLGFYKKIDYGYNMKFNVFIGVTHHLLLTGWGLWNWNHRPHIKKAVWVIVFSSLALLLELFDFSPYYLVMDAHATWHAATVPITVLWWSFIVDDCVFEFNRFKRKVV